MTKARDLGNLAGSATGLATDSELSAAVAGIDLTNVTRIVPVDSNISVPGAPTSVSAGVGNTQSIVSFVAPTSNGGSTILSYTVISSPGSIKKSGTTSPITITGLTNGTAYTFTVKAHNIAGSSTASTASTSVTPSPAFNVDYLVVAGGGGGPGHGGGAGAGGLRSTVTNTGGLGTLESAHSTLPDTNYTVTVGGGGAGSVAAQFGVNGAQGSNSVFSTITSTGGGYGATQTTSGAPPGGAGGSGGGGGEGGGAAGGARTASPVQGFDGGSTPSGAPGYGGGGGGGAGAVGGTGSNTNGGNGGAGVAVSITGTSVTYAGGGGGGTYQTGGNGGSGGAGGGGGSPVGSGSDTAGTAGTANTGGGAGSGHRYGDAAAAVAGAAGGSGIVILRYLTTDGTITIGAGLTGTTATDGSHKVTTLTAGTGNVSWAV